MSHGVDRSRFHICLIMFHDFVSVLTNTYDKHTSFNTHFPRFTLPPPTHTEWGEGWKKGGSVCVCVCVCGRCVSIPYPPWHNPQSGLECVGRVDWIFKYVIHARILDVCVFLTVYRVNQISWYRQYQYQHTNTKFCLFRIHLYQEYNCKDK